MNDRELEAYRAARTPCPRCQARCLMQRGRFVECWWPRCGWVGKEWPAMQPLPWEVP